MTDHRREAGIVVGHLSRALLDGSRDLKTVPGLIKRIIEAEMWREWEDPKSGRQMGPFASFAAFVMAPASDGGLGSTIDQLLGLCQDDPEAREALYNIQAAPTGTSEAAALRRLRKDAPELHAEVLADRMSAHAAMVQAGFRRKTVSVPVDQPESVARTLKRHMKPDQLAQLVAYLTES